jgi:hypothetical protein
MLLNARQRTKKEHNKKKNNIKQNKKQLDKGLFSIPPCHLISPEKQKKETRVMKLKSTFFFINSIPVRSNLTKSERLYLIKKILVKYAYTYLHISPPRL